MVSDRGIELDALVSSDGRIRFQGRIHFKPGVTALVGHSGAGKSTCLAVLAGLIRPKRGTIRLGERTLLDTQRGIFVAPHLRKMALVFQDLALFPHMTAVQNVAYGIAGQRAEERAMVWLARMQIAHVASRKPSTFSGGEAQRVALARALASEPEALLLDEPFSALHQALRETLLDELGTLIAQRPIPTILVTHDESDVRVLGANAIELRDGAVLT